MTDLSVLREEIDGIDREMTALFEKRMDICRQVAEYKIETGKKVFDKERELSKLAALGALTDNAFYRQGVTELFQQVMAMSRKLQYQLLEAHGITETVPFQMVEELNRHQVKVVYQGVEGAYSHQAMLEYFGPQTESFHVESFRDAMEALKRGQADYAVLPLENSTAGIVNDNYDLLEEFDNYIVGEHIIPIDHALLGLPEAELSDIRTVYSHPQGLMQCAGFLDAHRDWEKISFPNTAGAAKKVLEDGDKTKAAIASTAAAEYYGLKVLKEQVRFSKTNSTRFIIVTGQKIFRRDASKISICFELPHKSGQLYNILSHFIYNGLNMTKIESRPIVDRNWEYHFFVDFEGNLNDSAVKNALRGIEEEALHLKILGNY